MWPMCVTLVISVQKASQPLFHTVPYCSILFHTVPYCSYCFLTKLFPKVSVASKSFKICSERFAELCDSNMSVRRPGVATKTSQPLPCATWQHTTTTWHNVAQRGTTHLSRSVVFSTVFTKTLHDFRRFVSHSLACFHSSSYPQQVSTSQIESPNHSTPDDRHWQTIRAPLQFLVSHKSYWVLLKQCSPHWAGTLLRVTLVTTLYYLLFDLILLSIPAASQSPETFSSPQVFYSVISCHVFLWVSANSAQLVSLRRSPKHSMVKDGTLYNTETYWNILKHTETYWNILKHTETYWNILKHTETLVSGMDTMDIWCILHGLRFNPCLIHGLAVQTVYPSRNPGLSRSIQVSGPFELWPLFAHVGPPVDDAAADLGKRETHGILNSFKPIQKCETAGTRQSKTNQKFAHREYNGESKWKQYQ